MVTILYICRYLMCTRKRTGSQLNLLHENKTKVNDKNNLKQKLTSIRNPCVVMIVSIIAVSMDVILCDYSVCRWKAWKMN